MRGGMRECLVNINRQKRQRLCWLEIMTDEKKGILKSWRCQEACVKHDEIMKMLENISTGGKDLRIVTKNMHCIQESATKVENITLKYQPTDQRLIQGWVLLSNLLSW